MDLETLKQKYRDINRKSIQQRIKLTSVIEQWIIDTMNFYGVDCDGVNCNKWEKSNPTEDKYRKRDAFHKTENKLIYSQIKYRMPNSGNDILTSIIQPYYGLESLKKCFQNLEAEQIEKHVWARDFRFDGDFYCSLDSSWRYLRIIPYSLIKPVLKESLDEWIESGVELNYSNRWYDSSVHDGIKLNWTSDKGRNSFDSGVAKINAFLPETFFKDDQIKIVEMIEPPQYLFN